MGITLNAKKTRMKRAQRIFLKEIHAEAESTIVSPVEIKQGEDNFSPSIYDDWVQLGNEIEDDVARCLTRQRPNHRSYAMLVPVAAAHPLRTQVVRPDGATFGSQARFPIEMLFYGVPGLEDRFAPDPTELAQPVKFLGDKVDFAENVVPGIDAAHFEPFRPIFDFIQAKIEAP